MHCYHIIPKDDLWLLRREGGLRRDESFIRKKKAMQAGQRMLKLVGGTLVIHGKRGKVKEKRISPSRGGALPFPAACDSMPSGVGMKVD